MRSLLFAALVFAATPFASAQATFGVKAGLNTSFYSCPSSNDLDPKLGFVGGGVVRYDINPGFGIGVEALYTQKGAKYTDPNNSNLDETYAFDYIEIPAYVRLAVPLGQTLEGGVTLGGYAGIPIKTGGNDIDGDFDLDANTDYGALIGLDVGSGPYYVEGRYSLGLAQVSDDDTFFLDLPANELPDLKNQTVSLTFGVRFGGMSRY